MARYPDPMSHLHDDEHGSRARAAHTRRVARRTAGIGGAALIAWAAAGCLPALPGAPLDRPAYPTGLAAAGENLLVVSSDFDRAYTDGALLVADLARVRAAAAAAPTGAPVVVRDAYRDATLLLPPFGERPALTSGGERAYVPVRGDNAVIAVDITPDGTLSCGMGAPPAQCGDGPQALKLPDIDPFDVVILSEERDAGGLRRVRAAVGFLASPRVMLLSDDRARDGRSLRVDASLSLGEGIAGVRALVHRPAERGRAPLMIAGVDLDASVTGRLGAQLVLFRPAVDTPVARVDVSADSGALSVRDMVLVSGADGAQGALVVVLRGSGTSGPEALARYELDDLGPLPTARLSAVAATCRGPTALALARPGPDAVTPGAAGDFEELLLLTCHDNDTVALVDPLTLMPVDVLRFIGRGPYDVVVHPTADPPEAYVSFFSDNSVGVLRLVDETGRRALVFAGRIGEAAPPPEDGRE